MGFPKPKFGGTLRAELNDGFHSLPSLFQNSENPSNWMIEIV
jgi:hypothetical protein